MLLEYWYVTWVPICYLSTGMLLEYQYVTWVQIYNCTAHITLQAQETLQLVTLPSEYEYLDSLDSGYGDTTTFTSGPFLASKYRPYIPQSKFEVREWVVETLEYLS